MPLPFVIGGAAITAGRRLALQSDYWMFADPDHAASVVWDARIDAAAATALQGGADGDPWERGPA